MKAESRSQVGIEISGGIALWGTVDPCLVQLRKDSLGGPQGCFSVAFAKGGALTKVESEVLTEQQPIFSFPDFPFRLPPSFSTTTALRPH